MIQDVLKNVSSPSEGAEENPLLLVHYNHNEAIWSDIIQKTPKGHFDKETGLRSYEPLGEMLKDPEFEAQLDQTFKLSKAREGEKKVIGDELENVGIDMAANYKFTPAPGDSLPEVQELARQGKKGDDLMVLMPYNMVKFLANQKGTLSINQKTGYPQFFLGAVLGIIGSGLASSAAKVLGLGALGSIGLGALGGGAGSFLGSHLGGKGGRQAGKSALMGGIGGGLAGGLGHFMNGSNYNITGGLTESGAKQLASEQVAQQGAQQAAQEAAKKAASSGFDWSNVGKVLAVGSIVPQILGAQQEKKALKKERDRQLREEETRRQQIARMNDSLMDGGIQPELYNNPPLRRLNPNLDYDNPEFYRGGRGHHWFARYKTGGHVESPVRYLKGKKGGAIDGVEKGQEDNVYTTLPAGTYILDASVVSDIGDGNTKAGKKIWDKFINHYTKGAPKVKSHPVKVALSAGEMMFPVEGVARLGGGSVDRGAAIMNKMIKRIRHQKASKGSELPPAALPLHQYLRGLV